MTIVVVLLTVAVAVLAVLVVGLLRAHGAILRHLHDLGAGLGAEIDPGAPLATLADTRRGPGELMATDITGVDPAGDAVALRLVGARHDTLLVFLSSGCSSCQPFWDALHRPGGLDPARDTRVVVVTQGPDAELPAEVHRLAPPGSTVVMSSEAWRDHEVPGSPFVALVEAGTGRIRGSGTGEDWDQVAALLQVAAGAGDQTSRDRPRGPRTAGDRAREKQLDSILLAAGIPPGDPSLYPSADTPGDPSPYPSADTAEVPGP